MAFIHALSMFDPAETAAPGLDDSEETRDLDKTQYLLVKTCNLFVKIRKGTFHCFTSHCHYGQKELLEIFLAYYGHYGAFTRGKSTGFKRGQSESTTFFNKF